MTPKEEVQELVQNFIEFADGTDPNDYESFNKETEKINAKKCALVAIEFAENQFEKYCLSEIGLHWTKDDERTDGSYDHFRYLKEELKKL